MRNSLFYFILFFPIVTLAQVFGEVTIDWEEINSASSTNIKSQVPFFKGNSYDYNSSLQTLNYNLNLDNKSLLDEKNIQISNIVYEPVAANLLGKLNLNAIPNSIKAFLYTTKSRDNIQNFLRISPIIRDNSGYKKVKSFSYTINKGSTKKSSAVKNTTSISNSIDHSYITSLLDYYCLQLHFR